MTLNKNSRRRLTIAVDGFSSCGKSTFAKALAARFGYIFVDTGAMYRAVTLFALENGAIRSGIVDEEALVALLPKIDIAFRFNPARQWRPGRGQDPHYRGEQLRQWRQLDR